MLPREKLVELGVESLTISELFAVIIGSGSSKKSVFELSDEITSSPDFRKSILEQRLEYWTKVHGIGLTKASRLLASVELTRRLMHEKPKQLKIKSSKDVSNYLAEQIVGKLTESFFVLCLNSQNQITFRKELHHGFQDFVMTDMKSLFSTILQTGCKSFICAHNHPSGNENPSSEDRELTKKIIQGSKYLDLQCLDHVIVTAGKHYSFFENEFDLFE